MLNFPDHPFASYFSGNTVQICPVGALTAKPYRFRAPPGTWRRSRRRAPRARCSAGALQSSTNRLVRFLGVDSEPVNHGWLCDKGRYGFEYVHDEQRVVVPLVRTGSELVETPWPEALDAVAATLERVRSLHGAGAIAVLGGAGSNEDAYAWARLAKGVIGTDHVDAQLADGLPAEVVLGLPRRDRRLRPRRGDRAARARPQGGAARSAPARAQGRGRARRPGHRLLGGRLRVERVVSTSMCGSGRGGRRRRALVQR